MKSIMIIMLLIFPVTGLAKNRIAEKVYQQKTCTAENFPDSKLIVIEARRRLYTRLRIDCLTDTYAIEYDFAYKRYEAIGQALTYAAITQKRAGIVLIMRRQKDYKYLNNLLFTIKKLKLPITVWTVNNNFKLKKEEIYYENEYENEPRGIKKKLIIS